MKELFRLAWQVQRLRKYGYPYPALYLFPNAPMPPIFNLERSVTFAKAESAAMKCLMIRMNDE